MPVRTSQATWNGNLRDGNGMIKFGSGAYRGAYSYDTRFESGVGTNPEELLGAAHAGCFSMALANALTKDGSKVNSVDTTATVHLDKTDAGNSITHIDLVTTGNIEGIDAEKFTAAAENTKNTCIVSRALAAVPMTVKATLV